MPEWLLVILAFPMGILGMYLLALFLKAIGIRPGKTNHWWELGDLDP